MSEWGEGGGGDGEGGGFQSSTVQGGGGGGGEGGPKAAQYRLAFARQRTAMKYRHKLWSAIATRSVCRFLGPGLQGLFVATGNLSYRTECHHW